MDQLDFFAIDASPDNASTPEARNFLLRGARAVEVLAPAGAGQHRRHHALHRDHRRQSPGHGG